MMHGDLTEITVSFDFQVAVLHFSFFSRPAVPPSEPVQPARMGTFYSTTTVVTHPDGSTVKLSFSSAPSAPPSPNKGEITLPRKHMRCSSLCSALAVLRTADAAAQKQRLDVSF